jgi:hypothetical protein
VHRQLLAAIALAAGIAAGAQQQPVYIHLTVLLNDHFNIQSTEERFKMAAAALKRQSDACPKCSVSATLVFTGATSEAFAMRNQATGLADAVRELVRSGLADIGYDGADEPTPAMRPQINFRRARSPEQRWLARLEPTEWFLTEHKDFASGEPDPERSGGLKRTIEVFGMPAYIRGATPAFETGADSELAHLLRRMKVQAVLAGVPEAPALPARDLPGFRGAATTIAKMVSLDECCVAELYWQDGFLRLSDSGGEGSPGIVPAYKGPEPLKKMLDGLDRSRTHIVQVQLGNPGLYLPDGFEKTSLANPVRYGYDNPKWKVIPEDQLRPRKETEEAFRAEEATLRWIIGEFIPGAPGSRFIGPRSLMRAAKNSTGAAVPGEYLKEAAADLLAQWQIIGNHPPSFARGGGEFFSLADMFQMLVMAVAEQSRTNRAPGSVQLLPPFGPFEMTDEQGPAATTVSRASVIQACLAIAPSLANQEWKPLPENRIPPWVTMEGNRYNAAQFLRIVAETYLQPDGPALKAPTSQVWSAAALTLPSTRPQWERGATWTLKPASLDLGATR